MRACVQTGRRAGRQDRGMRLQTTTKKRPFYVLISNLA